MVTLTDGIAGLALVASGLSVWYAKVAPARARQSSVRDELRREMSALTHAVDLIASEVRQGEAVSDVSADLAAVPRRLSELTGRVELPGINLDLARAQVVLFESYWFSVHSVQSRLASTRSHVESMSSRELGAGSGGYLASQKEELYRLERALPPATITLTQEIKKVKDLTSEILAALNKADRR